MLFYESFDGLKVLRAVLTQGANEILGQRITLVDVTADGANVTLDAVGLRLGLDALMVVGVGHGLTVGDSARLGDAANGSFRDIPLHSVP